MSGTHVFADKTPVFFEPAVGAEKVRGYVIGRRSDGKKTLYTLELIHETKEFGLVYDYVRNVLPHMLSTAVMHPYPTHVTDMEKRRVRMDLPAHVLEKKHSSQAKEPSQSRGAPKRRRAAVPEPQVQDEPEDQDEPTDAEGPSSPIMRPQTPERELEDAKGRAKEQPEDQEMPNAEPEVEEGELRQSQIDVVLDPLTEALAEYGEKTNEGAAGAGNEDTTRAPAKGSVFTFGTKPLTRVAPPYRHVHEEATLPILEPSQPESCEQDTLDINTDRLREDAHPLRNIEEHPKWPVRKVPAPVMAVLASALVMNPARRGTAADLVAAFDAASAQ